MKLTSRQKKLVIEREKKIRLFYKQRNLVSIKSKQNEYDNTDYPDMLIRYMVCMAYMPNFSVFVSGPYLAIPCEVEVAVGCV